MLRLALLARACVPVLHLHGDRDVGVPLGPNSAELVKRYQTLGGPAELVVVPGKGHEVVPEFFENERLFEFFLNHGRRKALQQREPESEDLEQSFRKSNGKSARSRSKEHA